MTTTSNERIKELEREVAELREAQRFLLNAYVAALLDLHFPFDAERPALELILQEFPATRARLRRVMRV